MARWRSVQYRLKYSVFNFGTRGISLSILFCFFSLTACKSDRSIDRAAAKEVSDSFMSHLISDRASNALDEMEGVKTTQRTQTEAQVRELFDYCGRPLDSEFKHDEIGFRMYSNGRRKPMRKFFYAANTTQYRKGVCFFAVEVVPEQNNLRVASFGPLKLLSGQLPDYLR